MSFHFTADTDYVYQEHDDSDLLGLTNLTVNGIQLVTTTVYGHITIHVMHPDYHLVLNGTLRHDPDVEVLVIAYNGLNPCLSAGPDGHYMYGVETIANDNTRYSSGTGLIITSVDTSANAEWNMKQYGGLSLSGGSFTGKGGVISSSRGIGIYSASGSADSTTDHATFDVIDTKFTKTGTTARREIRFNNRNTINGNVVNMQVDGFQISQRKVNDVFSLNIINGEIVQLANSTSNALLTDLDTSNSITETYDLGTDSLGGTNFFKVTNASNGSGTRLMPKDDVGLDRMLGGLITYKNVQFNMSDADGNGILDVNMGMIDTDNGYRKNANGYDHTSSNVYTETSDSVGNFDVLKVLTSVTNIDSQGSYSNSDWDTVNYSNRFKVNRFGLDDSTDDRFTFHFWHYNYNYTPITVAMKNLNTLVVPWTLFTDEEITETDIVVVLNYTTIDTNDKLYDAAKAYIHNDYERQETVYITAQGNAGNYDIDVDSEAAAPFAFNGTKITIKADTFTGILTTTGEVRFLNSAVISGSIFDVNGDSDITATVPTGYDYQINVYTSLSAAEAETGAIASSTNFRYTSTELGGTMLWFRMSQADDSYIIENYLMPAAPGSYAVSLVITSENAALGAIKAVTDRLNTMLDVSNGAQVFNAAALKNGLTTDLTNISTFNHETDIVANVARVVQVDVVLENEDLPALADDIAKIASKTKLLPALF